MLVPWTLLSGNVKKRAPAIEHRCLSVQWEWWTFYDTIRSVHIAATKRLPSKHLFGKWECNSHVRLERSGIITGYSILGFKMGIANGLFYCETLILRQIDAMVYGIFVIIWYRIWIKQKRCMVLRYHAIYWFKEAFLLNIGHKSLYKLKILCFTSGLGWVFVVTN